MKAQSPARIRSMEFVEGALAQADPVRVARLAGRALEADPRNPVALALLGHLESGAARALPLYVRATAAGGAGPGLPGTVLALAAAALAFAEADPRAAVDLLLPRLGPSGVPALDAAVARVLAGAAFAAGDVEAGARATAALADPGERGWFRFLHAARTGSGARAALDEALRAAPRIPDPVLRPGPAAASANPACLFPGEAAEAVAQAAVLPGLAGHPGAVLLLAAGA